MVVNKQRVVPDDETGDGLREIVTSAWIKERYQISYHFIVRHIQTGGLRPFKIGTHANRFYKDEVIAFMEPRQNSRTNRKVG